MPGLEKRKAIRKRIDFSMEVTLVFRGAEFLPDVGTYNFAGTDIAAGGMGLKTDAPLQLADHLTLQFTLPGEKKTLNLAGRVRSVSAKTDPKLKNHRKIGLQFEGISEADQTYLSNYIGTTFLIY
jgi:c-di-GMP-binding flagellar brake protein YcgR